MLRKRPFGIRPLLSLVVALLLVLCLTPVQAFSAGNGTLTLNYAYNGVAFQIYRAADTNGSLTGAFSGYPVIIPDPGSAGAWQNTAATLAAYASGDAISPDAVGTTTGGSIRFSGLEDGIYLVTGEASRYENYTYTPIPFLIRITGSAGSVTANVKYDRSGGDLPEYSTYTVKKVWSGDTLAARPESVTVQLLHNGVVCDTVILQASNSWSHTWNRLEVSGTYQVVEVDVPEGYTVSVLQNGTAFTVTNTAKTPDQPQPPQKPNLPQTGQLWWPVFLLLGAGIILLLLGRRKSRRTTDE